MVQKHLVRLALSLGLVLAWPASTAAQTAQPKAATPEEAMEMFLKAAADSNFSRMMELWGTENGSAASTKMPPDRQKRMYVMYAYLKGGTFRVANVVAHPENEKKRNMLLDFRRGDCNKIVPATVVESRKDGWLVNFIDINVVGVPGRNCGDGTPRPDSASAG